LVAAGADVEKELGELGLRSLHVAAAMGHVETVKVLVELGADKEAKMAAGMTPLQVSIRVGHHQVAQVLRELESAARAQQARRPWGVPSRRLSRTWRRRERRRTAWRQSCWRRRSARRRSIRRCGSLHLALHRAPQRAVGW
jgi:hypothetical protein